MFRSYPYRGPEDLPRLRTLVTAIWQEEGPLAPFTVCDFDWRLHQHPGIDPTRRIHIWESRAGQVVGFVWYTPPDDVEFVILPIHREMSLFQPMLEWAIELYRHETGERDAPATWAMDSDVSLPFLLQRLGFAASARQLLHLHWERGDLPTANPVPEGFRIRQVHGEVDLDQRAAVHQAAFNPSRLTPESYRHLMRSAGYRSELDIVVENPEGNLVAFALGWLDPESRLGEIEPVGTHPEYRGQGLARAATTELLRRLRDREAAQVRLCTHSDALANGLYSALGFKLATRSRRYLRSREG